MFCKTNNMLLAEPYNIFSDLDRKWTDTHIVYIT